MRIGEFTVDLVDPGGSSEVGEGDLAILIRQPRPHGAGMRSGGDAEVDELVRDPVAMVVLNQPRDRVGCAHRTLRGKRTQQEGLVDHRLARHHQGSKEDVVIVRRVSGIDSDELVSVMQKRYEAVELIVKSWITVGQRIRVGRIRV